MKEHPIPQDITGYRFHIVGSMTLKQFGEAALGVVLAFMIYQTNLLAFIKWPLIVLVFGGGFAAAFLPIEERPLSHWLSTFFSILYKPTQFFWKRSYNIPAPFLFKGDQNQVVQLQELDLTPARRQRIKEFISSTTPQAADSGFTTEEQQRMASIMGIFQTQAPTQVVTETREVITEKPHLTVRIRSMRQFQIPAEEESGIPTDRVVINSLDGTEDLGSTFILNPDTPHSSSNKKDTFLLAEEVAQSLQIPENNPVEIETQKAEQEIAALTQQQTINPAERAYVEQEGVQATAVNASQAVQFNAALPFPNKPTIPNKLVGMVLTPSNDLIAGAIVEIKTKEGHVTRAVKTNALGQFFITTPLNNGDFVVTVDKDGYTFHPLTIQLKGEIVEPLEIRSN